MSTIYIHPTATHNMNSLVALKQATGLTITRGKRYLRLVPGEGDSAPVQTRRMPQPSQVTSFLKAPTHRSWPTPEGPFHPGGGSAA